MLFSCLHLHVLVFAEYCPQAATVKECISWSGEKKYKNYMK